jgi:hypothetical protein
MGKKSKMTLVPVAHICNPSYSGSRDQVDCSSKSAQANSSQDPIRKTLHENRAGGVAQDEGLEFKPQCLKKKKIQDEDPF